MYVVTGFWKLVAVPYVFLNRVITALMNEQTPQQTIRRRRERGSSRAQERYHAPNVHPGELPQHPTRQLIQSKLPKAAGAAQRRTHEQKEQKKKERQKEEEEQE